MSFDIKHVDGKSTRIERVAKLLKVPPKKAGSLFERPCPNQRD